MCERDSPGLAVAQAHQPAATVSADDRRVFLHRLRRDRRQTLVRRRRQPFRKSSKLKGIDQNLTARWLGAKNRRFGLLSQGRVQIFAMPHARKAS